MWLLELAADNVAGLRGLLPEPFDVFSHVGNLKGGALVAVAALYLRLVVERKRSGAEYLTRGQLRWFRWLWVPGVVVVTAAINAVTETSWGVSLIGHMLFRNTTPDFLDLVYSVVFGGVWAALGWRRVRSQTENW